MTLYQKKYRIESARYPGWDYRARGWYFVTICSQRKAHIFGEVIASQMRFSQIGAIAESELHSLSSHYKNVQVNTHVVMPNHIHAILMIEGDHSFSPSPRALPRLSGIWPSPGSLAAIIRSYKAGVTRQCRQLRIAQSIWQPRFYDKILRSDAIISAVREYIRNNPANWGNDLDNEIPVET
jgi:REP element-mobilizing transposase RayT